MPTDPDPPPIPDVEADEEWMGYLPGHEPATVRFVNVLLIVALALALIVVAIASITAP